MKIVLTSTLKQLEPLETYSDDNGKELVLWHQDTLDAGLFERLLKEYGRPDILLSSAHPEYPVDGIDCYYLPEDLANIAHAIDLLSDIKDCPTEYCFNFMINKNQTNRSLLIKLVEWFKLNSYNYTWSGTDTFNCAEILTELSLISEDLREHITKPGFGISPRFIELPKGINQSNLAIWNYALGEMFSKSAVSLITESIGAEKIINLTEKSLFSVQALTFPIWIGGYRQADHWADHGFDTFSDIINHDYQYCDTLIERCFRAFEDNLQVLTDLEYASNLRAQYMPRLLQNRDNLKSNIDQAFMKKWNQMPKQLQNSVTAMMKTWPAWARNPVSFKLLNIN